MKKKQQIPGLIIVLLIAAVIILTVRHFHIKDFNTIREGQFYTSGQPRGMDYTRLLYKYHIATIVNIRPASEHLEKNWRNEEITWTRSNGVNYIEMPIDKDKYFPDESILNKFFAIMAEKKNLPVLLHGGGDDKRVAMLVAAWLGSTQGATREEVLTIARRIIDDRDITPEEIRFIELVTK